MVRNLFLARHVEAELDEEVRAHLEMLAEENSRGGMTPEEARRAARMELGGVDQVKEQVHERQIGNWMQSVLEDCRFAVRQLRRNWGSTAVAVITLALGIGAAAAIFSVVDGVLLHPYPYKGVERLATISVFADDQFRAWRFPAAAFVEFEKQNHTFDDMFGVVWRRVHVTRSNGAEEFTGGSVTPDAFESLGISPLLGRPLTDSDAKSDAAPVFVISYRLWTKLFDRDPNIIGSMHTVNATRMTLVGVMPPRFQIGDFDLWLPLNITRDAFVPGAGVTSNEIWIVGHLKTGVKPETAAADIQLIAARFEKDDPIYFPSRFKIVVNTLDSQAVGKNFKFALFAVMAAVAGLLLIACSNVANLLLARAATREKEFGIRSALGASRRRLIRQMLVESFSLAVVSCAFGCLLAYLALQGMVAVIPPDTVPPEALITLSPVALLVALCATIVTTVFCGLAPALYAYRADPQVALGSNGKGLSADRRQGKLRCSLVVAEVALAIVLCVSSGLIMRSLSALQNVNLGFDPSRVVYADISLPEGQYDSAQQKHFIFRKVLDRISQFPGVLAATETTNFPPYTFGWTTVVISGQTPPENRNTAAIFCTEGYFRTLSVSLVRGRLFSKNDIDSARHAVIVNQRLVRDRFGTENPIGQQVRFSDYETWPDWPHDHYFEIIGVVGDAKNTGLQEPPRPEIYLPGTLAGAPPRGIMVSTSGNPAAIIQQLRSEISAIDPNIAVVETGTIASRLGHDYYARPRFLVFILFTFAAIALVLVVVGVSGVMAYAVSRQTQEIGIRIALGAPQLRILRMILAKGARLVAAGITVGLIASSALTRFLSSQIWGVSATDLWTFGAVVILVTLAGLIACLIPAKRASRVDPMVALRYE